MFIDPADTAVTSPELFTDAIPLFVEDHVYDKVGVPVAFEVRGKVPLAHTAVPPVIGFAIGRSLTVTISTFDSFAPVHVPIQETLASRLYQVV